VTRPSTEKRPTGQGEKGKKIKGVIWGEHRETPGGNKDMEGGRLVRWGSRKKEKNGTKAIGREKGGKK